MAAVTSRRPRMRATTLLGASIVGVVAGAVLAEGVLSLNHTTTSEPPDQPRPTVRMSIGPEYYTPPPPTVINCGPNTDPGMLLMRNEVCMSPDPEDEQLRKLIEQWKKNQPRVSPPPVGGVTLCRDGTFSKSTGRGTCSWHGGVAP